MSNENEDFHASYQHLATQMKGLAEKDGDAYLPNIKPIGPVDYVFIGMEPSLGKWARTVDEARSKVDAGFCNFTSSIEDFILHFCIQHYLCGHEQRYHLTDLSKGAMLVNNAAIDRTERYDRWFELLLAEIDVVAPGAEVFAVGNAVKQQLERRHFPKPFTQVMHYSPLAARARKAGIVGHEDIFEEFGKVMTLDAVLATADVVPKAAVPNIFRDETLKRLAKKKQLSTSQQMLIFNYELAFESFKAM
jgi:hypothetical protein